MLPGEAALSPTPY